MKTTSNYNQTIKNRLAELGVTYTEYDNTFLGVNRTSMCHAFDGGIGAIPEEHAYPCTLSEIKKVLPSNLYVIWGMKNDDEIFLEVYE